MPRTTPILFPAALRQLATLGQRLRMARLRRSYSAQSVAKRAGIARATLYLVEEGDAGVSLATYASVLRVLSLQADLDLIARDDTLGRKLQDLNLPVRKTASRRTAPAPPIGEEPTPAPSALPPPS